METKIIQLGDPLLRAKSAVVNIPISKRELNISGKLMKIAEETSGVGISAPQIGKPIQMLIISCHPTKNYPDFPEIKPFVVINPKIVSRSKKMEMDWEGCLSIPGIRAIVPRYEEIDVEYMTINGGMVKTEMKGILARIFQHEYDHLIGIVFLDRVLNSFDIVTDKEYKKILRGEYK